MALDNFRTIELIWDKANKSIIKTIKTASSDTTGRYLSVKILDGGQEVTLNNAKMQLYWEHPNFNTSGTDDFNTINNGGLFKMTFSDEMLTNIGELNAHLVLTLTDGRITSDGFPIEVFKGTDNGVVVPTNGSGLVEQVARKIDKGNVTLGDLTQEVKLAMTGGTVAVVGEDAVGTENVKDSAITGKKLADGAVTIEKTALEAGDYVKFNGNTIDVEIPNFKILDNLVVNGDFNNGLENTYVNKDISNVTLSNVGNQLRVVGTGANTGYEFQHTRRVYGKMFVKATLTSNVDTTVTVRRRGNIHNNFTSNLTANQPKTVYGILDQDDVEGEFVTLFIKGAGTLIVDDVIAIDLTSDFGVGNEPGTETINELIGDSWSNYYQVNLMQSELNSKQDKLIAGDNVSLDGNVINVDVGNANIDLTNYTTKSELTSAINGVSDISDLANRKATEAKGIADNVSVKTTDLQSQINNLVVSGDSSVEAAQARVDVSGESHSSLKGRLDSDHEEMVSRFDGGYLNAMFPPVPFTPVVPDANFYDSANFKYYADENMTTPATDNTGRVQALVDYLSASGGGTLFIPTGKYAFKSSINWKTKVSLKGASKISTQLFAEGNNHSLILGTIGTSTGADFANPNVWFEDCQFTDFLIDNKGLSYVGPTVGGKGLFILYMRRALFRDLILMNTLGTALGCDFLVDTVIENIFTDRAGRSSYPDGYGGNSGIGIGTCALPEEPVVVSNCFTYNSGNYGVFVETQHNPAGYKAQYAKIVNCHSQGNKLGFGNKGSGGTQFIGCSAFKNIKVGFHLTQESTGDRIIGCVSNENGTAGISIEKAHKGDVMISDCETIGNGEHGVRLGSTIHQQPNIMISNLKTGNNGFNGIYSEGRVERLKLDNIIAFNNGQAVGAVTANKRAIRIEGNNDGVSLSNITFYDDQEIKTQTTGISVSSGTKKLLLNGNQNISYPPAEGYIISTPTEEVTKGVNTGI